jgi:hypothetical protein
VERQPSQRRARGPGPSAARRRVAIDPVAVDGHEGELDRDEEAGGQDQQEGGEEAERGVDGSGPEWSPPT